MKFKKGMRVKILSETEIREQFAGGLLPEYVRFLCGIAGQIVTLSRVARTDRWYGSLSEFEVKDMVRPESPPHAKNWRYDLDIVERYDVDPQIFGGVVVYLKGVPIGEVYRIKDPWGYAYYEKGNFGYLSYINGYGDWSGTAEVMTKTLIEDHIQGLQALKDKKAKITKQLLRFA